MVFFLFIMDELVDYCNCLSCIGFYGGFSYSSSSSTICVGD